MATIATQLPTVAAPITPTYTAVTAADKFAATGGTYVISYVNGATAGTATLWVLEQVAVPPVGAQTPAIPTGATKWSDALISATLGSNASRIIVLNDLQTPNYIDVNGFINLKHNGTLTTITVAIFGPF